MKKIKILNNYFAGEKGEIFSVKNQRFYKLKQNKCHGNFVLKLEGKHYYVDYLVCKAYYPKLNILHIVHLDDNLLNNDINNLIVFKNKRKLCEFIKNKYKTEKVKTIKNMNDYYISLCGRIFSIKGRSIKELKFNRNKVILNNRLFTINFLLRENFKEIINDNYFREKIRKKFSINKNIEIKKSFCSDNYYVSSSGEVFSSFSPIKINKLKPQLCKGYYDFNIDGKTILAHKLVMETFVGKRKKRQQIRHLDGNKTNNSIKNLAYGTIAENNLDNIKNKINIGENNPRAKVKNKQVISLINDINDMNISLQDLMKKYNVTKDFINNLVFRKKWNHITKDYNINENFKLNFKTNNKKIRCKKEFSKDEILSSIKEYYKESDVKIKRVPNFSKYYASSFGDVFSFNGLKMKVLKPCLSRGYKAVTLFGKDKKKTYKIHVLVAKLFINKINKNHTLVRHLDGCKFNNNVDNLAWGTTEDNIKDNYTNKIY